MPLKRYQSLVADSQRWDDFVARPGDIVVTTPPKCGTTWTQMICALLVFQTPELPAPLLRLSPWIDMTTRSRRDLFSALAAQGHRRFVKTHTPLDGLPSDPTVTYVCVGRDPRDVAISMRHHQDNLDLEHVLQARARAAVQDGIELEPPPPARPRPDDPASRFWMWVDDDTDPTETVSSLRSTLHHLETFRTAPADLDIVQMHYSDLLRDLEGEMRRLALRLDIHVAEALWSSLVEAASLDHMRRRSTDIVPGSDPQQWHDPTAFFRTGTSEQWRSILDDEGERRYAERARSLASTGLIDWVHCPALP